MGMKKTTRKQLRTIRRRRLALVRNGGLRGIDIQFVGRVYELCGGPLHDDTVGVQALGGIGPVWRLQAQPDGEDGTLRAVPTLQAQSQPIAVLLQEGVVREGVSKAGQHAMHFVARCFKAQYHRRLALACPRGAGPHADPRHGARRGLAVPAHGPEGLVVERAP